jgi:hypothetical protein
MLSDSIRVCDGAEVADVDFLVRFDMDVGLVLDMIVGFVAGFFVGPYGQSS